MNRSFLLLAIIVLASCSTDESAVGGQGTGQASAAVSNLSRDQKMAVARKIWQNECGGTISGLTSWNAGEGFPSLGIGHFIWYPSGVSGPFEESFPAFLNFARQRGLQPPAWAFGPCPWSSRAQFSAEINGPRLSQMRQFLAGTVEAQMDFILARSRASLPKLLAEAPSPERARIAANYRNVAQSAQGSYALIDYVNFKGEGTNPGERYQGQGWGLLQVLENMRTTVPGAPAAAEFSRAAKFVLDRRIALSPPARGESRWQAGWRARCETYARPL